MESLRQIPPVNDILRSDELVAFRHILELPFAMRIVDSVLKEMRSFLSRNGTVISRPELTSMIAKDVADRLKISLRPSLRRVINGSGVVLHTNLGRAPLPASAIEHLREVSVGYCNLEFSLEDGARGRRDHHIESVLRQILDCESAIVVNNNAAAVLLVLNAFGEGGEVIVSRGEEVEIGGAFRIPEVMAKSGCRLREVGTTNRTRIEDYERAIQPDTRLLLRVHPSNFRVTGFTERPSLADFVALGKRRSLPTFEDLGSGCLFPLEGYGITGEPVVSDSIGAGVDIVCFSGDKLLGGAQAGIIAGRREHIHKIRSNPLYRALRVDKLTISVLEAVLLSYLRGAPEEIPIYRLLRIPESELRERAEAFAGRAGDLAEAVPLSSVVGGGSAPESFFASWGVRLHKPGWTEAGMEERLRNSVPPVIGRIEEGRVVLDFRTILPGEEDELLMVLRSF